MISVAVDMYADYFARHGITTLIEIKRPTTPSDNPGTIRLFADWPTAKHKLSVAVVDDDLKEIDLEKLDRGAN